MRNARGLSLIEVAIVLGAAAALAATIFGGVKMWNNHMDEVVSRADKAGYDRALKETAQRDKKELLDAQTQIADLEAQKTAQAEAHAQAQAGEKREHDKEVARAKEETADLLRRISSGELVLRDPGRGRSGDSRPGSVDQKGAGGGSQASSATAAPSGGGEAVSQGLSPEASGFLLLEADRADEVASDLALCWGIARDDRAKVGTAQTP